MALMAQPWRHPDSGIYHIRRQIPEAIRSAFGGKSLHKVSLKTKDFAKAAVLFAQANAQLEAEFELARDRLAKTGDPRPTRRHEADQLVQGYFEGSPLTEGGLDGPERLLLAWLETGRGLWNSTPHGCSNIAESTSDNWWMLANNAALFRGHEATRRHAREGGSPNRMWHEPDHRFTKGAKDRQLGRVVEQVARHYRLDDERLIAELPDAVRAFLDRQPTEPVRARKPRSASSRSRPDMRLLELFGCWEEKKKPALKSAYEYRTSVEDFVDFVGDIGIGEISKDDLLDYRDEVAKLPSSMPRADRELSFSERRARHSGKGKPVSAATVKKRVGAIQAMLSFAHEEKFIARNEGRDIPIHGYSKTGRKRRNFEEEDLQRLLSSSLFTQPATWRTDRSVSHVTLYWLFLLGLTTGARLEEVGQAAVADVKRRDAIRYIDVDDYTPEDTAEPKHLKTENSRRLVPIHNLLLDLGFEEYLAAIAAAGHTQLFPDLRPDMFGNRTKEASRTANRLIDKEVSKDARLVFHSGRHGFKDLATEAEIPTRTVDQMCGHAPTSVGGKYGSGVSLKALHRALHRIDWTFLPWQSLKDAVSSVDWTTVIPKHASYVTPNGVTS